MQIYDTFPAFYPPPIKCDTEIIGVGSEELSVEAVLVDCATRPNVNGDDIGAVRNTAEAVSVTIEAPGSRAYGVPNFSANAASVATSGSAIVCDIATKAVYRTGWIKSGRQ